MFSYFSRCIVREKSDPFLLLLGELAPRTKLMTGTLLGGVAPRAEPMGLLFRV